MAESTPKRRWFQFSLLTFLLCVTLVGTWLGFVVNRRDPNAPRPLTSTSTLEVFLVSPTVTPNTHSVPAPSNGDTVFLIDPPILTTVDFATVQRSEASQDVPPSPTLTFHLTPSGATIGGCHQKLKRHVVGSRGQRQCCVRGKDHGGFVERFYRPWRRDWKTSRRNLPFTHRHVACDSTGAILMRDKSQLIWAGNDVRLARYSTHPGCANENWGQCCLPPRWFADWLR